MTPLGAPPTSAMLKRPSAASRIPSDIMIRNNFRCLSVANRSNAAHATCSSSTRRSVPLEATLVASITPDVNAPSKFLLATRVASAIAARLTGFNWPEALQLGALMNTRGLMELIVLNIGLDMKVISPTLFAMMVVMALVTTMATTPVLQWLILRRN